MASKRRYATISEVEQFADITSTNDTEFEDRISQAEELIDAYVGPQPKHFSTIYHGQITALTNSNKTIADTSTSSQLTSADNYFNYSVIEIIGGTGAGQQAFINASNQTNKTITMASAFSTTPDTTSVFRIYQFGKFPRYQDVYSGPSGTTYYKSIPEAVKRAVAAQVLFMINEADTLDNSTKKSESFLNYSYDRGDSASPSAISKLISPRAKVLLRGIVNRTGRLVSGGPYVGF